MDNYLDIYFYKQAYLDLKKLNSIQLKKHFTLTKYSESRLGNAEYFYKLYPTFDIEYYKKLNEDINFLTNYKLISHFFSHGRYEGRQYNEQSKYKNNCIFIEPCHGIGNRLRALSSAYVLAKKTNKKLIILWIPDCHCDCLFNELFTVPEEVDVYSNYSELDYSTIDYYNYNEIEKYSVKNKYIELNTEKNIYIKSYCVINNELTSWYDECEFIKSLEPVAHILNLVNNTIIDNNTIAVHIRMEGGVDYTTKTYENVENWTNEETTLLFKWREKSHLYYFINQINNYINKNDKYKFYLATDREDTYDFIKKMYGNRIICLDRTLYNRSSSQLMYALADIYNLAKCDILLGSWWSSFTELAQRCGDFKTCILSNNFHNDEISNTNLLNNNINKGISIVTACMNRNNNLLNVISSWLTCLHINEIIIIDWNSDIFVSKTLYNIKDDRLKIYRVYNEKKWCLSRAFNLGFKLTSYDKICKLDCDDIIDKLYIEKHKLKSNTFYTGNWKHARNYNSLQINGKIIVYRHDLFKINGYNENITVYGWDDSDLYLRLQSILNLTKLDICNDTISHIEHDLNTRIKHIDNNQCSFKNKEQFIHFNRILSEDVLPKWNIQCKTSDYKFINNTTLICTNKYNITINNINDNIVNKIKNFVIKTY
jgi:hypothetical protein